MEKFLKSLPDSLRGQEVCAPSIYAFMSDEPPGHSVDVWENWYGSLNQFQQAYVDAQIRERSEQFGSGGP